jgi:hypothetical protein
MKLLCIAFPLFFALPLCAATITVDPAGGGDFTDIQAAIDAASDGDTVLVKTGEYVITAPIDFNRPYAPDDPASPSVKNIAARSEGGPEVTVIRMSATPARAERASVVLFEHGETAASMLDGFTIAGGKGTELDDLGGGVGGGVLCRNGSSPSIRNCTIAGNSADEPAEGTSGGGGVGCSASSPSFEKCEISSNRGIAGGAIYCGNGSSPSFVDCTIAGNSSIIPGGGGAYVIGSSPTFTNCAMNGNSASADGGALHLVNAPARLSGCTLSGNSAARGGAVFCSGASPVLTDCVISTNRAVSICVEGVCCGGQGGGLCLMDFSAPVLGDCSIQGNAAGPEFAEGGAIYSLNSSPALTGCSVSGNVVEGEISTVGGIAIYNGSPALARCSFRENASGGAYLYGGGPSVTDCAIVRNGGWGIRCAASSPILSGCTISQNAGGPGLSCENEASAIVERCTIEANAGTCGLQFNDSAGTVTDCLIAGNAANGVFCAYSSAAFVNCTIAENSGREGAGVQCSVYATPSLVNCIIWGNPGGSFGAYGDFRPWTAWSCIESEPAWPGEGNTNADPRFVRPGMWVVPPGDEAPAWISGDYRLQSGSPCIDAGTSEGAPATDIEGHIRPCGAGIDIGAYEFGDCAGPQQFVRGDSNADGMTDLGDAIAILFALFMSEPIPCLKAADVINDGKLGIPDVIFLLSYLFLNSQAPDEPLRSCGIDQTPDELTCDSFPACP